VACCHQSEQDASGLSDEKFLVGRLRLALTLIRLLLSVWPEGRGVVEHRQQQVGEQDRLSYHGTEMRECAGGTPALERRIRRA
jgi:hypothetical protein